MSSPGEAQRKSSDTEDQPDNTAKILEVPVFHPSTEEFQNPLEFIDKLVTEAKEYGMCKVVPPQGWKVNLNTFLKRK